MMSQRARASLVSYPARCSLSLTLGPLHFQPAENTDIKCSYVLEIWQILQIVGDAYSQASSHLFRRKIWFINHSESAHQSKPPSKISHGFNRAHGLKSCLPLNASECNRD